MIASVFGHAWGLYRKHFGVIAAVVIVIWLPLNLLASYRAYFVYGPDDFKASFKFSQFLENFVGIIATACVISIGYTSHLGRHPTFGGSMNIGINSYGRMWWTRFLRQLAFVLGVMLLVIPGIYLFVRLAFIEQVAVCERVYGVAAMRRSFELTERRFWQVFLLQLVVMAMQVAAGVCVCLPTVLIPPMDHWVVDAAISLFADFVFAYGTLCMLSAYLCLSQNPDTAELADEPTGGSAAADANLVIEEGPLSVS